MRPHHEGLEMERLIRLVGCRGSFQPVSPPGNCRHGLVGLYGCLLPNTMI